MTKARHGLWRAALIAGGLAWGGGVAVAQEEAAPLAGPEIKSIEVPGVRAQYVDVDAAQLRGLDRAVPLQVFFDAVRGLGSEDVGLGLSAEQAAGVAAELRLFREEIAAFLEVSGGEIRELAGRLPANERGRAVGEMRGLERTGVMLGRIERAGSGARADRAGGQPESDRRRDRRVQLAEGFRLRFRDRGAGTDDRDEAMDSMTMAGEDESGLGEIKARLRELRSEAPSVAVLQTRVWQVLSEPQRARAGAALDAHIATERAKQEERRMERDIEQRKAAATDRAVPSDRAPAPAGIDLDDATIDRMLAALDAGEIPDRLWDRLPERVKRRVESLPENERAGAVARLLRLRRDGEKREPKRPG